jgi:hypothetical protein
VRPLREEDFQSRLRRWPPASRISRATSGSSPSFGLKWRDPRRGWSTRKPLSTGTS